MFASGLINSSIDLLFVNRRDGINIVIRFIFQSGIPCLVFEVLSAVFILKGANADDPDFFMLNHIIMVRYKHRNILLKNIDNV